MSGHGARRIRARPRRPIGAGLAIERLSTCIGGQSPQCAGGHQGTSLHNMLAGTVSTECWRYTNIERITPMRHATARSDGRDSGLTRLNEDCVASNRSHSEVPTQVGPITPCTRFQGAGWELKLRDGEEGSPHYRKAFDRGRRNETHFTPTACRFDVNFAPEFRPIESHNLMMCLAL